jgi:hypothetical protein
MSKMRKCCVSHNKTEWFVPFFFIFQRYLLKFNLFLTFGV